MSLLTQEQLTQLQTEVQQELERREWAESGDNVMAEYICVLLGNGNPRDRVKAEMEDLVGPEFDTPFLDWLFTRRDALRSSPTPASAPSPEKAPAAAAEPAAESAAAAPASRIFASAIEGTKRKADPAPEAQNKRRLPDGPLGAPTGPRSMQQQQQQNPTMGGAGRSLQDRLAPARGMPNQRGGMAIRGGGMGGRGGAMGMGHNGPGFRPGQPTGFPGNQQQQQFMPGQEEMMMQMMAMQANMMQMAQQMAQMQNGQETTGRPTRGNRNAPGKPPVKAAHAHASNPTRGGAAGGAIPDKPTSTALCKFGVGCSNARCTYSHPSPVADEKTGMVLSEEACEAGKNCKDAECVKSHVSPAAVSGGAAQSGPSRVLCKYQTCTNPACAFRHEDADGNFIPPPALTAGAGAKAAESQEQSAGGLSLDAPLDDKPTERPCRYAERCTRADCKFTHPASRPTPRASTTKPRGGGAALPFSKRGAASSTASATDGIVGGMAKSTKFGAAPAASGLNPAAGEFKPGAAAGSTDPELQVTM